MSTSVKPLERLLEVIREDFKDASFNILTSISIHELAKKKIQAIIDLIAPITEEFSDKEAWDTFTTYINDIYTLEGFLLKLKAPTKFETEPKNVASSSIHIEAWTKEREECKNNLASVLALSSSETLGFWEPGLDDTLLLRGMVDRINTDESVCAISCKNLRSVHKGLKDLLVKAEAAGSGLTSEAMEYAIKAAWLVSAAAEEARASDTTEPRKYHLSQNKVWGFGTSLVTAIQAGEGASLKAKYDEFLKELKGEKSLILPCMKLILASRDTPRPFMFQNRRLVQYCEKVAELYNKSEAKELSTLRVVERAISKSLEALNTASKLPSGLLGDMISTSKKEEIQGAYREAADANQPGFGKKWTKPRIGTTHGWMKSMGESERQREPLSKETVKVSVKVGSTIGSPHEYSLDTKIGAFIWEESEKGNKRVTGVQHREKRLSTSKKLRDIADAGSHIDLTLVFTGDDKNPGGAEMHDDDDDEDNDDNDDGDKGNAKSHSVSPFKMVQMPRKDSSEDASDNAKSPSMSSLQMVQMPRKDSSGNASDNSNSRSMSPPQLVQMPRSSSPQVSYPAPPPHQRNPSWDMVNAPPTLNPSTSSRILPGSQSSSQPGPQPNAQPSYQPGPNAQSSSQPSSQAPVSRQVQSAQLARPPLPRKGFFGGPGRGQQ
ncbi:SubName: Full=Uncharacterized protein {ECO:0000313/EMBL:CCA67062.1} [Serendipita indica DSM 11827]|nr:SubName: Full=Uncharacterized protein {ECO:0000313/EMBL:CCA67062.1} [Serendipita indica DSM 11827]